MNIHRRDFLKTASATEMSLLTSAVPMPAEAAPRKTAPDQRAVTDRMALGAWINDVRTEPWPFASWPPVILDEIAERSIMFRERTR